MAMVFEFRFLFISHLLLVSVSYGNANYGKCPRSFHCGKLGRIQFPFTKAEKPDCGLMMVHNCDDPNPSSEPMIELHKTEKLLWRLTGVFPQLHMITLFNPDLHTRLQHNDSCDAFNSNMTNISIPANSPLISFDIKYNLTLFKCHQYFNISPPTGFIKHPCAGFDIYNFRDDPDFKPDQKRHFSPCSNLVLPRKDLPDTKNLQSFLSSEMLLEVRLSDDCDQCYNHQGGWCQLDSNNKFYCNKADPCDPSKFWKLALGLGLGFGAVIVFVLIVRR